MARKPKHEEHENHERWLVSYADFITLLFAFFVVMYAISSVNEGKYRVLSSALVSAFSHPQRTVEPIQYGTPLRSPIIQHESVVKDENTVSRVGVDHRIMPTQNELANMEKIADEIQYNLKELIDKELITVTKTNLGLEIEITSNILFASGVAVLSSQAISPLKKIAAVLSKAPNDINVEGYTDNVPISTVNFPSNWELSAARAASVVRLFTQTGISPTRLKAIGFAEYRPIADNATEYGRNKNRRVAIMVLNKPDEKRITLGLGGKSKATQQVQPPHPQINDNSDKNSGKNSDINRSDPMLLLPPSVKPAITTLPLTTSRPTPAKETALSEEAPSAGKPADTVAPATVVKPADAVSLPVLQILPKGKGDQK